MESCLFHATADDILFVAQTLLCPTQFGPEAGKVLTTNVLELHSFQIVPNTLIRIHFWRIAGQLLQVDTTCSTAGKKFLHCATAMNRRPVR